MSNKKSIISKKLLKELVSDSKFLEKKLEKPTFRDAVESLLKTFSDRRMDMRFFNGKLIELCGDEARMPIAYVLDTNNRAIIDELMKAGISKKVVDFLDEIMARFGFAFQNFRLAVEYPDDWRTMNWRDRYDTKRQELVFRLSILKECKETVALTGLARSYLQFTENILNHILNAHKSAKKDLPNLKPKFKKSRIRKIKRIIEQIASLDA